MGWEKDLGTLFKGDLLEKSEPQERRIRILLSYLGAIHPYLGAIHSEVMAREMTMVGGRK